MPTKWEARFSSSSEASESWCATAAVAADDFLDVDVFPFREASLSALSLAAFSSAAFFFFLHSFSE
jgi:hypothetical protein